jgi:hypothetical protein
MRKYLIYYILLFTVVTGFYFLFAYFQLSGGQFIYPIDDAYIHLAIARKFGESGFWSINFNSFDSASSSILYTLLLSSLIKIFGNNIYYPMFLNIVAGYLTTYWIYKYFKYFYSEKELKLGLFLFLPISLLYVMVILGMEQTIHILLSVMAIYFIKKNFNSDFFDKKDSVKLLFTILFLAMVRFESMFFIFCLGIILLVNKKLKEAILVFLFGALPIIIFGALSVMKGGFFFPNSVIIKGSYPEGNILISIWSIFKNGILLNISFYKLFMFPLICIGIYMFDQYKGQKFKILLKKEYLLLIIVGTILLQSIFAMIKYRYENYLMIMLVLVMVPMGVEYFKKIKFEKKGPANYLFAVFFIGFCLVGVYRFWVSHLAVKNSSKNVEEQQVEMGRFLNRFYKGQKVVANDIGAIAYFGNVQLLDIVGLGSTDIARFYIENKGLDETELNNILYIFLTNYISENDYKVAVIYPDWYPDHVPGNWIPVASWKIKNSLGTAQNRVVWYAFDQKQAKILKENLKKFDLNKNVIEYLYIYE